MGPVAAIIFLGILITVMASVVYLFMVAHTDTAEKIKQGCHPEAWNQYGQPTIWSCPNKSAASYDTIPPLSSYPADSSSREYRTGS